jgi:hypothetical protein
VNLVHASPPTVALPRDGGGPSRARQLVNFVVFEAAWFACILGVARGEPGWGTLVVIAAILWHVAVSARPSTELALVGLLAAIGLVAESAVVSQGHVVYPNGQPLAWVAPYWMVALWAEFAIALNVTLRWLKRRPVLAGVLGAFFGPLSFMGGVRLGAARFVDEPAALVTLAVMWAVLMPLVMWLSDHLDGVAAVPSSSGNPDA